MPSALLQKRITSLPNNATPKIKCQTHYDEVAANKSITSLAIARSLAKQRNTGPHQLKPARYEVAQPWDTGHGVVCAKSSPGVHPFVTQ